LADAALAVIGQAGYCLWSLASSSAS
jgi:hypothetical protein